MRLLARPIVYVPLAIAFAILVVVRVRSIDPKPELTASTLGWLTLAAALALAAIPLWTMRSRLLLLRLGHDIPVRRLLAVTSFGNLGSQVFPAGTGEVAKGYYLAKLHDTPGLTVTAVLALERLLGFALMTLTAAAAAVAFRAGTPFGVGALLAGLVIGAGVLAVAARISWRSDGDGSSRIGAALRRLVASWGTLVSSPQTLIVFTGLSLAVYAVLGSGMIAAGRAVGVDLDPLQGWAILGLGLSAGTLSGLPFGLGAADVAIAALAVWTGASASEGTLLAVGMRLTLTLPLSALGVGAYLMLSRRLGEEASRDAAATR